MADTGRPLRYSEQIPFRTSTEQVEALRWMSQLSGKDRAALIRDGIELLRAVYVYEQQQAHPEREQ